MKEKETELMVDALLDPNVDQIAVQKKMRESAVFGQELAAMQQVWDELGSLDDVQPPAGMKKRFYNQLEAYSRGLGDSQHKQSSSFATQLKRWLLPLVAATACLMIGIVIGGSNRQVLPLSQVQPQAQVDLVGLMANSPAERLSVVQSSRGLENPDERVLGALLHVLRTDESVNVRLGAVDALKAFGNSELVREGLVRALPQQESPMVQIALIDSIIQLQGASAEDSLKHLLDSNTVNPLVRKHANQTLEAWR